MKNYKNETKEEIIKRAKEAIGIKFADIDKDGYLKEKKGGIGHMIEKEWFGYDINNDSEPDFGKAKIELKCTPHIKGKNDKIRAKERLVCNMINYESEAEKNKVFEDSSFWHKCENLLIMAYEYKKNIDKRLFSMDMVSFFTYSEEDLKIIKNDWNIIISKIREGKAHEISEGDTMYLGACTKGKNSSSSMKKQPYSDILAKSRAYSLKQSYMTYILNHNVFAKEKGNESIIKKDNVDVLNNISIKVFVEKKFETYYGKSQKELVKLLEINGVNDVDKASTKKEKNIPKNLNKMIVSKILGIKGDPEETEEFLKANIVPKTIRIEKDGKIKESMSFPAFRFKELVNENWENSQTKETFEQTKFMFIIFKKNEETDYVLEKVKFWNMPENDIEKVHDVWEKTKQVIIDGVILEEKDKRIFNNLPKKRDSSVVHVRPHSSESAYKFADGKVIGDLKYADELPDGRWMTKQSFFLNNEYILDQIKN